MLTMRSRKRSKKTMDTTHGITTEDVLGVSQPLLVEEKKKLQKWWYHLSASEKRMMREMVFRV